jgi:DNA-binding PadR family transcriptional regulator
MSQAELRGLVLSILARREAYGVEIAAMLSARPGATDAAEVPEGAVYPVLRWIERMGLAATRWVDVGEAAPRRRYYLLTPLGEKAAARYAPGQGHPHPRPRPSMSAARS